MGPNKTTTKQSRPLPISENFDMVKVTANCLFFSTNVTYNTVVNLKSPKKSLKMFFTIGSLKCTSVHYILMLWNYVDNQQIFASNVKKMHVLCLFCFALFIVTNIQEPELSRIEPGALKIKEHQTLAWLLMNNPLPRPPHPPFVSVI